MSTVKGATKRGGWNYRVMRHVSSLGGREVETFAIHECYYSSGQGPDEMPDSCTVEPVPIACDNVNEIRSTLTLIRKALDKPVVDYAAVGPARQRRAE